MADGSKPKFVFESKAADKSTFHVVKFKGTEGLSTIYRFDITLVSKEANLDLDKILQNPAEFTIKRDDGDIPFKGILSSFEQLQQSGGMVFYRAELVPKLWWTTLTHHNQIFLKKNIQGFLDDVFKDGGLKQGLNFDFKLQGSYPTWEYICQYDESHFNFISRWLERDGMYYYFEQTDQGEKMIITDTHISHMPMPEGTSLTYSPPSNMDHTHRDEVVKTFMLKQQPLPKKVVLKDYNYRKPSLEMKAEAVVSSKGMGEIYIYGEHFQTPGDGAKLAKIRAEEFLCREKIFHGVSTVPYIRTGYVFELKDHYRKDFNQRYLTTEVTHEGSQEAYLVSGLRLHLSKDEDRLYYRNSFSCIPATTQFRAERNSFKPKFAGSMNAKIDASGSGKYAELDSEGRYKVVLPLDMSGRSGGKATTWLRMAQPYGGSDHGMHFPLHKNTEVLLTCIDGDPDRPIIQSTVPNPETPSLVSGTNQTQCKLTTGGQNQIYMEDQDGSQRILMKSPTKNTFFRIGSHNDPPSPGIPAADDGSSSDDSESDDGIKLYTEGDLKIGSWNALSYTLGDTTEVTIGATQELKVGDFMETVIGATQEFKLAYVTEVDIAEKLGLKTAETDLEAEMTKLQGEVTTLTGEQTALKGSVTKLEGENTSLKGEVTKLEGEHTALKGSVTKLEGEATALKGSVTKLEGENTSLKGSVTKLEGEATSLKGAVTKLEGENTELKGTVTQINGEVTGIRGSVTRLDGETTSLAGSIAQIVGLKTVL
ncbi:MAG: type VI secretion system tip protein VgrG [Pseudodesulfovibrio sp.]